MKSLLKMIITMVLIFLVSSCATTNYQIPEKYQLDNQLERVNSVQSIQMQKGPAFTTFNQAFEDPVTVMKRRDTVTFSESKNEWTKVDLQSFILNSGPGDYYLIILHAPAIGLTSVDTISFVLLSNVLRAKSDYLELGNTRYIVDRIYKINSTEQMRAIRNQILQQDQYPE